MRVDAHGHRKGAYKAKVGNLEGTIDQQEVLGLEITVKEARRVAGIDTSEKLVREPLDLIKGQAFGVRNHVLLQIAFSKLKNKAEFVVLVNDIEQRDNVLMLYGLQDADFTESCRGNAFFGVRRHGLLQRNHLLRSEILSFPNLAVRTLSDAFHAEVPAH